MPLGAMPRRVKWPVQDETHGHALAVLGAPTVTSTRSPTAARTRGVPVPQSHFELSKATP
jgi:hypothetical protein